MNRSHRKQIRASNQPMVGRRQRLAGSRSPNQTIMQMQRDVGNKAVCRLLAARQRETQQKQAGGVLQLKLEETTEKGFYIDSRDQAYPALIFRRNQDGTYKEMYSGKLYVYIELTGQFRDDQNGYFDPYTRSTYYQTPYDGYYQDEFGGYYYYNGEYYYPYSTETTITNNQEQNVPEEIPDEQARQWLVKELIGDSRGKAEAFLESYRWTLPSKAVEIIENWNRAFPDQKFSLSDYGLSLDDKIEETDQQPSESTSRKQPGSIAFLEINGRNMECRLLTNEGGYHDIYEIVSDIPIISGIPNGGLLVRVPVNPLENPTQKGMIMHKQLGSKIAVPRIYNKPVNDGFYLVERIKHECDPSQWGGDIPLKQLSDTHWKQLEQIEVILNGIANEVWSNQGGYEPVPDFRPANIRFNDGNQIVMIDFSEQSENFQENDMMDFAAKLKENVHQFAGLIREKKSRVNPYVYDFLTHRFPPDLLRLMKESTAF